MLNSLEKSLNAKRHFWPLISLALLLTSTVLLSACINLPDANAHIGTTPTTTHTAVPTLQPSPSISLTLSEQGSSQLNTFQQWISLMQQYGGNVSDYQQQYTSDQHSLNTAVSNQAYKTALDTLSGHVAAIKLPALKAETDGLQAKLSQEASDWTSQHTYYDSYDGITYNLGYEYAGVVNYPAQGLIDSAQTIADYQYAIGQLNVWLTNFDAYKTNFSDNTPYNQVHQTDTQLLQKYADTTGKVLVVSFSEQAMRVYQDGQLIKAFQVVSGMPDHPSLPGTWWVESRLKDIQFTSGKKEGEEGYYPPTPIAYALGYHTGGYFIHESWWRTQYGPNNQFPHIDPYGTSFAYQGSHGCINMSTDTVTWVYNFAEQDTTKIIMY
jgi:lipoprotein-anchoring transpeptidase ErfK/SrfK